MGDWEHTKKFDGSSLYCVVRVPLLRLNVESPQVSEGC